MRKIYRGFMIEDKIFKRFRQMAKKEHITYSEFLVKLMESFNKEVKK